MARHAFASARGGARRPASAGELDLDAGLTATTTAWPGDHGGGAALDASWWFRDWIGASFMRQGAVRHRRRRLLSYFSVNVAVRHPAGPLRLTGTLGLVHQHEEPRSALMDAPIEAALGVGDGIRHRAGGRAGLQLALPVKELALGDVYVALDLDATVFADDDRGPRWMAGAGLALESSRGGYEMRCCLVLVACDPRRRRSTRCRVPARR